LFMDQLSNAIRFTAVLAILACCAACFVGCIEGLVEYFNKYAYIEIALYGRFPFALFPNARLEADLILSP